MAKIVEKTVYETSDGGSFNTRLEAEVHEKKVVIGAVFSKSYDPLIKGLTFDQCQSIIRHLSANLSEIVTELELSDLI